MKKILLIVMACILCTNSYALSMDVYAFQSMLKRLGYYYGSINGKIDKETLNAIKLYDTDLKTCPIYVDQATCTLILEFQKEVNN
jgi:hypothetical protein